VIALLWRAAVLGTWCIGWYLALLAAQLNLILEPTDDAVRAAADSIPKGLVGCGICAVAAICGAALTRRLTWLWLAVPPGLVALALLAEPGSGGWAFMAWLAGTVAAAGISGARAVAPAVMRRPTSGAR
jgi:hypothetical protein